MLNIILGVSIISAMYWVYAKLYVWATMGRRTFWSLPNRFRFREHVNRVIAEAEADNDPNLHKLRTRLFWYPFICFAVLMGIMCTVLFIGAITGLIDFSEYA